MSWNNYGYPPRVKVAEHKEQIAKKLAKLLKKQPDLQPVLGVGNKAVAKTFWGKAWCENIESYQDYAYRIDRGRSYARRGAILDLKIKSGIVQALVYGTKVYKVEISITAATSMAWQNLITECAGKINSLIELLQGKFSEHIMQVITQPDKGLFPKPNEIKFSCSCLDHAMLCKHTSAVLYGIGMRLDDAPEQLFLLRQVDHTELLSSVNNDLSLEITTSTPIIDTDIETLFGIDLLPKAPAKVKKIKSKQKINK